MLGEPEVARRVHNQFTEQVVLLDDLGAFLFAPVFPAAAALSPNRDALHDELGIRAPPHVPIFFCPQVPCARGVVLRRCVVAGMVWCRVVVGAVCCQGV